MGKGGFLVTLLTLLLYGFNAVTSDSINVDDLDIRLVNGSAPNEGRVLVRRAPGLPWTTVCFTGPFYHAVPFQMCRALGYPFACGQQQAGPQRTDDLSLRGVETAFFLTSCSVDADDFRAGGCGFEYVAIQHPCSHEEDMWLTCGYGGMPDFDLRLAEGSYRDPPGLLQGRCGAEFEWSPVCANRFIYLKQGRVACTELGYADYAIRTFQRELNELDLQHRPNYTLFVDIGCVGNETSLTECQHYSLRGCTSYVTLECFSGVTEYDETAYLCGSKQLCDEGCKQTHPNEISDDGIFHYCQCDEACGLFDDCCYNQASTCSLGPPSLDFRGFNADQLGCVWLPGSQFTHIGYVAVNRCPSEWRDAGTRELCEGEVDAADVIGSLPFYDDEGVDFRNIFCAICNGRDLERLTKWNVSGSDNGRDSTAPLYHPSLNRTLPTKGWFVTPPRGHAPIRKCPAHLVDTCLDEFRGTQVEEACRAYYAPIKLDDTDIRYRNPHCAMCNGQIVVPENSCKDQVCPATCDPSPWGPCSGLCSPYDDFFTIEILFDISRSSIGGVSCPEGHIYDPFLERCRVLFCGAGYVIKGNECVPSDVMPPELRNNTHVLECLSKNGSIEVFRTINIHTVTEEESPGPSLYVVASSTVEALEIEEKFDAIAAAQDDQSDTLPCNISSFTIYLPFVSNISKTCPTVERNYLYQGQSGTFLTVAKYLKTSHEQVYAKEKAPQLCLKVADLNCPSLLTLEDSEYEVISNTNIEIIGTGTILSPSQYVIFPDDGTLVVCQSFPEGLEPQIRRAISFAGSILSLVCLAATFVTYCVLPELRNDAGKATMNFCLAMFAGILLFLLAGVFKLNHTACQIEAAFAHFAWLAAFFWMTMLALNVARTLTSMMPHRSSGRSSPIISKTLLIYMGLAWGIPAVIVTTCLILQYCNCTNLPVIYAEGDICWITDVTFLLAVFIGPIAISLVLTVTLLIVTIVSVRRSRIASKMVRTKGKFEDAKDELAIYTKLCFLVGATWVFGFVSAPLTGILVFSYIYIILNYLQALFIFIAFCLNKRVRRMWRKKLGIREGKRMKDALPDSSKQSGKDSGLSVQTLNEVTEDTKL